MKNKMTLLAVGLILFARSVLALPIPVPFGSPVFDPSLMVMFMKIMNNTNDQSDSLQTSVATGMSMLSSTVSTANTAASNAMTSARDVQKEGMKQVEKQKNAALSNVTDIANVQTGATMVQKTLMSPSDPALKSEMTADEVAQLSQIQGVAAADAASNAYALAIVAQGQAQKAGESVVAPVQSALAQSATINDVNKAMVDAAAIQTNQQIQYNKLMGATLEIEAASVIQEGNV